MTIGSSLARGAVPWLVDLDLSLGFFFMLLLVGSVAGTSYLSLSDQPALNDMLREGQGHVEKWTMYAKGSGSQMPELPDGKAQTCYRNILDHFQEECNDLEGESTFFFALELTNCFKIMHGEKPYECEKVGGRYPPLKKCTEDLMKNSDDRGTYHRNYNIAMSVCLYLQWKKWTHNTERIVSALSDQAKIAIVEIESVRSNIQGLSQSHEIIHDKLVSQKSSLENIVNKTSEIMGLQEDFGIVQRDIKSSADESLKALSQVGSSLQSLGIEVEKSIEFQERMSKVIEEANEKYERMEKTSVKALEHTTKSFQAIEERTQEINATQMELMRTTSESLTQNKISLDILNRVFENLSWVVWTAKNMGMLAQLFLVYALTIPVQLNNARGVLTLTCAFRFGGDLVLHKYFYSRGVPLQISILIRLPYSLCHLVIIIVILCHAYGDFRSKIMKKLQSEALTERTYENLNLLEKKLVGFIDSQFEERMRNHARDIKSAIQMEISRVGLEPLTSAHRRAVPNIGHPHGLSASPEAILMAPVESDNGLLQLSPPEELPQRATQRGKRKLEAPDQISPVRAGTRPRKNRSEPRSPMTNKQQSRQSTRTPSRDVTKDLTQGVVEKEGGEESPITEETSESGARRSARKRKSVYGNLNEGQIHR